MKSFRLIIYFVSLALAPIFIMGCGQNKQDGSGHQDESPSGASFNPGKGVSLTDETRHILGIETAEVMEENLPINIRFNVQVFSQKHRLELLGLDHTACDLHGSGFLPSEKASLVQPKQQVELVADNHETFNGFVLATQKAYAHSETEVVVGITDTLKKLKDGEFLKGTISLPRDEVVPVIPRSALLTTVEGTFVYTVNGNAYFRAEVKVGSKTDDKIEILDGLYLGDAVVTKSVEALWLIELRATKGGGHSH